MKRRRDDRLVTDAELLDLAHRLDDVTLDLVDRLCYLSTEPLPRLGVAGPHVQSQPCSRPPYNIGAEIILNELSNELGTTIRHICEHRGIEVPADANTIVSAARWLRKHRGTLATMPDAREQYTALCSILDRSKRCARAEEQEYHISQAMVDEANRQSVTALQVEKLARQLGEQGKGLNKNRVDYLRRKGHLYGEQDTDTGTWFYALGSVIAAHNRVKEQRRTRRAS